MNSRLRREPTLLLTGRSGIIGCTAADAVGTRYRWLDRGFVACDAFLVTSGLLRRRTVTALGTGPKPWHYLALVAGSLWLAARRSTSTVTGASPSTATAPDSANARAAAPSSTTAAAAVSATRERRRAVMDDRGHGRLGQRDGSRRASGFERRRDLHLSSSQGQRDHGVSVRRRGYELR